MIIVRNAICRHTAVMVCLCINHFALFDLFAFLPNGSVTELYNSSACIIDGITTIAKPSAGTGTNGTAKPTDSPKTGDNSNLALWFALLFVSGGAAIGTTVVSRKKKYNR